jgi:hypothetical protein
VKLEDGKELETEKIKFSVLDRGIGLLNNRLALDPLIGWDDKMNNPK